MQCSNKQDFKENKSKIKIPVIMKNKIKYNLYFEKFVGYYDSTDFKVNNIQIFDDSTIAFNNDNFKYKYCNQFYMRYNFLFGIGKLGSIDPLPDYKYTPDSVLITNYNFNNSSRNFILNKINDSIFVINFFINKDCYLIYKNASL